MMRYPPCKICKHSKSQHDRNFCADCQSFYLFGPKYEYEIDMENTLKWDVHHPYLPDNLSYIEKVAERRGLV